MLLESKKKIRLKKSNKNINALRSRYNLIIP